jgi:hypothetical protein
VCVLTHVNVDAIIEPELLFAIAKLFRFKDSLWRGSYDACWQAVRKFYPLTLFFV